MEPSDLNHPSDDDRLDEMLRLTADTIPDDGFTARVLATLPPPAGTPAIPLVATVCGSASGIVFAWSQGASLSDLATFARVATTIAVQVATALGAPWIWLAALITAAALFAGLRLATRGSLR